MRFLVAIFSVLLVLGACSDDSDEASSDAAAELLESEGLLDDDGAVSIGPAGPDDDDIDVAMCDYLFGPPEAVGDRLGTDVTLDENSGFGNLGANGGGIQCLYNDGDGPIVGLGLWSRDPTEGDASVTDVVVVDVPSGDIGFGGYHADYDGDTIDSDAIIEWIEDAGSRYAGQSV